MFLRNVYSTCTNARSYVPGMYPLTYSYNPSELSLHSNVLDRPLEKGLAKPLHTSPLIPCHRINPPIAPNGVASPVFRSLERITQQSATDTLALVRRAASKFAKAGCLSRWFCGVRSVSIGNSFDEKRYHCDGRSCCVRGGQTTNKRSQVKAGVILWQQNILDGLLGPQYGVPQCDGLFSSDSSDIWWQRIALIIT
jgi:hypothetical protein